MRPLIPIALIAGLVAACAPPRTPGTPVYETGYMDGCQAGYLDGGRSNNYLPTRDNQLYDVNADYTAGWNAGYRRCFDRAISVPRRR
jgi:hypothetical protein